MKAKLLQINASTLRIVLAVSLLLILAGATAGFIFAHQKLTDYAVEISKKKIDAKASETTIQSLQTVERQLEDNSEARKVADSLRLEDDHPEFTVSKELKSIAARNNISITLTTDAATDATGTTPPPATTPAPTAPQVNPTNPTNTFSITMEVRPKGGETFSDTTYKNFLQFLRDLEQNLPKIKVNGVSVSRESAEGSETGDTSRSSNGITVGPIDLEVYLKQ